MSTPTRASNGRKNLNEFNTAGSPCQSVQPCPENCERSEARIVVKQQKGPIICTTLLWVVIPAEKSQLSGGILRSRALFSAVLLLICLASGCASRRRAEVRASDTHRYADFVNERTAVLKVTAPEQESGSLMTSVWGSVHPPTARQSFAELAAHFARSTGGMEVIPPAETSERLELAGYDPTLQPDDEQLVKFARKLGCDTYLQAVVTEWRYSYVLTRQEAVIRFSLSLREVGSNKPIWSVRADHKAGGKSDRQVASEALKTAFERLREGR